MNDIPTPEWCDVCLNEKPCDCGGLWAYCLSDYPGEYAIVRIHPKNHGADYYKRSDIEPLLRELTTTTREQLLESESARNRNFQSASEALETVTKLSAELEATEKERDQEKEKKSEACAMVRIASSERDTALAELAKVKEGLKQREDRLQIDPGGSDKIDELESAMAWKDAELSRLRAANAAKDAALHKYGKHEWHCASYHTSHDQDCDCGLIDALTTPPVCVPVEVVAKLVKSVEGYFKLVLGGDYYGLQQLGHKIDEALALALAAPFLAKGDK